MHTRLILIRHGETDWSLKKRYCSFSDVDLNENGVKQAILLSERLRKDAVHKAYSSNMKRTLQFARILFKDLPIGFMPELREMNFGVFEGLTHEEIVERHPEIYKRWLDNPFNAVIPEGDSLACFKNRVEKALAQLISVNKGKTLAVVTHAGPIKIIINNVLKSKDIWKIVIDLASISIVEFKNGKTSIKLLNDTSYG